MFRRAQARRRAAWLADRRENVHMGLDRANFACAVAQEIVSRLVLSAGEMRVTRFGALQDADNLRLSIDARLMIQGRRRDRQRIAGLAPSPPSA